MTTELKIKIRSIFDSLQTNKEGSIKFISGINSSIYCYTEIYHDMLALAGHFNSLGIHKNTKAGIAGNNSYECILIDLALLYSGAIPVHLNSEILKDKTLFEPGFLDVLFHTAGFKHTITNSIPIDSIAGFLKGTHAKNQTQLKSADINLQTLTYNSTSGTTSIPRLIQVGSQNTELLITGIQQLFKFGPADKILLFLPQSIYLQRCLLYLSIISGTQVVFTNFLYAFSALTTENPSIVVGPPLYFEKLKELIESRLMNEDKQVKTEDLIGQNIRIFWTGSAKSNIHTLTFFNNLGYPVYEGYGMSEFGMIAKNYPLNCKSGSVGKLFPGVELKQDSNGQLYVKNNSQLENRYRDGTPCVDADGFIATKDIGYLDAEGFLFITGRINDTVILSNGKKINPFSVETELVKIPHIKHAFIYGNNKPFISAFLFSEVDYEVDVSDYIKRINSGLPDYAGILKYKVLKLPDLDFTGKKIRSQVEALMREKLQQFYAN